MATLLEISVRDMRKWPDGFQRLTQRADGEIIASAGFGTSFSVVKTEVAEDRETAVVTKADWVLESALRLEKNSKCFIANIDKTIAPSEDESSDSHANHTEAQQQQAHAAISYEQRFWDEAVLAWIKGAASDPNTRTWEDKASEYAKTAAAVADALMAERAKRLKASDA